MTLHDNHRLVKIRKKKNLDSPRSHQISTTVTQKNIILYLRLLSCHDSFFFKELILEKEEIKKVDEQERKDINKKFKC